MFAVPAGSALAPRVGTDRVVLSSKAAASLEVAAGDQIELTGQLVTVEAVSGDDEFSHAPVIWAATENAPSSGLTPGNATVIALTTTGGADLAAADQRRGTRTLTVAESLSAIGSYTSENGSLQLMRGFLFAISALVIGAFFTVWTIQRSGDIAILKALGASTGYLLKDALGQALVLLAVRHRRSAPQLAAGVGAAISASPARRAVRARPCPPCWSPAAVMIVLGSPARRVSLRTVTSVDPLTALGSAR